MQDSEWCIKRSLFTARHKLIFIYSDGGEEGSRESSESGKGNTHPSSSSHNLWLTHPKSHSKQVLHKDRKHTENQDSTMMETGLTRRVGATLTVIRTGGPWQMYQYQFTVHLLLLGYNYYNFSLSSFKSSLERLQLIQNTTESTGKDWWCCSHVRFSSVASCKPQILRTILPY